LLNITPLHYLGWERAVLVGSLSLPQQSVAAGSTSSDSSGALIMPPTMGTAMRLMISAPVPLPHTMGKRPAMIVATVMILGLTRITAPSSLSRCCFAIQIMGSQGAADGKLQRSRLRQELKDADRTTAGLQNASVFNAATNSGLSGLNRYALRS